MLLLGSQFRIITIRVVAILFSIPSSLLRLLFYCLSYQHLQQQSSLQHHEIKKEALGAAVSFLSSNKNYVCYRIIIVPMLCIVTAILLCNEKTKKL